ncbi:MAG: protein kinase domain-containing protein, partial [Planctomycetota bacterium]
MSFHPHDDAYARGDLSSGFGNTGAGSSGSGPPLPGPDLTSGFGATGPGGDAMANLDLSSGVGGTGPGGAPDDAQARGLTQGTLLAGRYEVVSLLGLGGMGAVYRVRDWQRKKDIALKVMLPSLLSRPKVVLRFEHEAELMLALAHPSIVRVFDIGRDEARGLRFFTMELLEGQSLRQWLEEKRAAGAEVTAEEALAITSQLLEALRYAHGTTVHRDLKPENVFVLAGDALKLKVLDFGIAKLHEGSQLTATSMAMGTAYYMAPEQQRDAASVDQRADLYSVSVMLYEMLTGKLPVGRFKTPAEERKALPRGLDALVLKGLEPEAKDRPASAEALLGEVRAIRSYLEGGGRRRGRGAGLLVGALLLLIAGGGAALYRAGVLDRWLKPAAPGGAELAVATVTPTGATATPIEPTEPGPARHEDPVSESPPAVPAAPALAIVDLEPAPGSVMTGHSASLTGQVTGGGIEAIRVNGLAERLDAEGRFSVRLSLDEGENEVEVRAGEGERAIERTITWIVDNTAPVLDVIAPAEGAVTREPQIRVRVRLEEANPQWVEVEGTPARRGVGGVYEVSVPLAAEGSNILRVLARDAAGNTKEATRTVVRDTQAPTLEIKAPRPGQLTGDRSFRVEVLARDASLDRVEIMGQPAKAVGGLFVASVDLAEGPNAVNVVARDTSGQETRATVIVTLDTQAPTIRVNAEPNEAGDRARVRIEADEVLARVELAGEVHQVGRPQFSTEIAVPPSGARLEVRATDNAGNLGTATLVLAPRPPPASDPTRPAEPSSSTGDELAKLEARIAKLDDLLLALGVRLTRFNREKPIGEEKLKVARVEQEAKQRDARRMEQLVQRGLVSQQEFEQATVAFKQAVLAHRKAEAEVKETEQARREATAERDRLTEERGRAVEKINALKGGAGEDLSDAERNLRAGRRFLRVNARREGVLVLKSGVQIRMIRRGVGPAPGRTDMVKVHYTMKLVDGTVVDDSRARGAPATFQPQQLVPGAAEGLLNVRPGGHAEIVIPSDLGYGPRGTRAGIGPNQVLI